MKVVLIILGILALLFTVLVMCCLHGSSSAEEYAEKLAKESKN